MSVFPRLLDAIAGPDAGIAAAARRQIDALTKPRGSLGRLEELAVRLAELRGGAPRVETPVVFVFAGDHGVVAEGVSAYPQSVTAQMVENFLAGGAAINVLARQAGARVIVADFGVAIPVQGHVGAAMPSGRAEPLSYQQIRIGPGTANIAAGPAMTREQAIAAIEAGAALAEDAVGGGRRSLRHRRDGHRQHDGGERDHRGDHRRSAGAGDRARDRRRRRDVAAQDRRRRSRARGESSGAARRPRGARRARRIRDRRPRRRDPRGRRAARARRRGRLHRDERRVDRGHARARGGATRSSPRTAPRSRDTGSPWSTSGSSRTSTSACDSAKGTGAALFIHLARAAARIFAEMATFKSAGVDGPTEPAT